jgi:hypothetical protein
MEDSFLCEPVCQNRGPRIQQFHPWRSTILQSALTWISCELSSCLARSVNSGCYMHFSCMICWEISTDVMCGHPDKDCRPVANLITKNWVEDSDVVQKLYLQRREITNRPGNYSAAAPESGRHHYFRFWSRLHAFLVHQLLGAEFFWKDDNHLSDKRFRNCYGTRRFIVTFKLSLSWASWNQSTCSHPVARSTYWFIKSKKLTSWACRTRNA